MVEPLESLGRQRHFIAPWSLGVALAGLTLALIPVGAAISVGLAGRTLNIYASQIALTILVIHIAFSALYERSGGWLDPAMVWLLLALVALALPLLWSTDLPGGVVAYMNFASGLVGGIAIAVIWKGVPHGFSWIDIGYAVFLVAGVAQLAFSLVDAGTVNAMHQAAQTPWGNSNFVAGCLVIGSFVLMARSLIVGIYIKWAMALGVTAIMVAALTLSRGAIVAASVGGMVFLWSVFSPMRERQRFEVSKNSADSVPLGQLVTRGLAVLAPVAAIFAVFWATELRAGVNDRVHRNVEDRLSIYGLAWNEYIENPLTGTGWASFRATAEQTSGFSTTFAHNFVLSMLQLGGALSIPYLLAIAYLAYRAARYGNLYLAPVAAGFAIAMTDPFFESFVGNMLWLPVLLIAGLPTGEVGRAQHTGTKLGVEVERRASSTSGRIAVAFGKHSLR